MLAILESLRCEVSCKLRSSAEGKIVARQTLQKRLPSTLNPNLEP